MVEDSPTPPPPTSPPTSSSPPPPPAALPPSKAEQAADVAKTAISAAVPEAGIALAAAQPIIDKAKEIKSEFDADPIGYITNRLFKWGGISLAAGVVMQLTAPYLMTNAINARNDLEDTVGLPHTVPPGTPVPQPTLTPLQSAFYTLAAAVANPDNTDAKNAVQELGAALNQTTSLQHMMDLSVQSTVQVPNPNVAPNPDGTCPAGYTKQTTGTPGEHVKGGGGSICIANDPYVSETVWTPTQSAPGNVDLYIGDVKTQLNAAIMALELPATDWVSAQTYVKNVHTEMNGIAAAYGWAQPFQDAGTPGVIQFPNAQTSWWSGFIVVIETPFSPVINSAELAYQGAKTLYNDASAVAGDVGKGLQVIGSAFVNFPRVFADSLSFVTQWSLSEIFSSVGPILMWVGVGAIAIAAVIKFGYIVYKQVEPRFAIKSRAFVSGFIQKHLDPLLRTAENVKIERKERILEGTIERVSTDPVVEPIVVGDIETARIERRGEEERAIHRANAAFDAAAVQKQAEEIRDEMGMKGLADVKTTDKPDDGAAGPGETVIKTKTEAMGNISKEDADVGLVEEGYVVPDPNAPTASEMAEAERNRLESLPPIKGKTPELELAEIKKYQDTPSWMNLTFEEKREKISKFIEDIIDDHRLDDNNVDPRYDAVIEVLATQEADLARKVEEDAVSKALASQPIKKHTVEDDMKLLSELSGQSLASEFAGEIPPASGMYVAPPPTEPTSDEVEESEEKEKRRQKRRKTPPREEPEE